MMPVGPLMIEHRLIERMISVFVQHVKSVSAPAMIDLTLIDKGVDFMRSYADRCHHGKEEDILFQALNLKSLTPDEKKIFNELLEEHTVARATVRSLASAREQALMGKAEAYQEIITIVNKIAVLYPAHIGKEDKRFFIPIMQYFTKEEQAEMLRRFDDFDRQLIHEKYTKVVENLESSSKPAEPIISTVSGVAAVYTCTVCGYEYDPAKGDSKHGIPGGTPFESLPPDWVCPICGAAKEMFVKKVDAYEEKYPYISKQA